VAGRISSSLPQGSQLLKLKALIGTRERRRGKGREREQGGAPLHLEPDGGPLQQPCGWRFRGSGSSSPRGELQSWSWILAPCVRGSSSPTRVETAPAAGRRRPRVSTRGVQDDRLRVGGSHAWGVGVRATGATCSFWGAVAGSYPTKYVSNLKFLGPIRPSPTRSQ
jgi:hypothetical protein